MESRTYHSASIIALQVLLGFVVVNAILGLTHVLLLALACFILQTLCYSLSRFFKLFVPAILGSAALSYLALILNYFINSGINGPTLFIFFFTFNLLIVIAPDRLRYVWVFLHTVVVSALLYIEYAQPGLIVNSYTGALSRAYDIYLTYLITLAFIYFVSMYLRNHYDQEKKLAEARFDSLAEKNQLVTFQETNIRAKNELLDRIAHIQSHELRAPVSSIMGLMSILRECDDKHAGECMKMLETAVSELDLKIRLVVKHTEEIQP